MATAKRKASKRTKKSATQSIAHDHFAHPAHDEFLPKLYLGFAIGMTVFLWITTVVVYPSLPATIVTHYGITGQADGWAAKSIWVVGLLPFIQTLLMALFVWIYNKPQYMHMPSSLMVELLPQPYRSHIYQVFRRTTSAIAALISILFTYLGTASLLAVGGTASINNWVIFVLIFVILLVAVVSSLGSWHIVQAAVHHHRHSTSRR